MTNTAHIPPKALENPAALVDLSADRLYAAGWREAARWAKRDDLVSDIGSRAYDDSLQTAKSNVAHATVLAMLARHEQALKLALKALENSPQGVFVDTSKAALRGQALASLRAILGAGPVSVAEAEAGAPVEQKAVPQRVGQIPLVIYTDGACKGNPGIGGWGALIQGPGGPQELFGGEANTTNNRMEMMAVIKGLQATPVASKITLFLDSEYVRKGITEWIGGWKRNGWMKTTGEPVKNAELWREMDALVSTRSVTWQWVKGHAGNPGNERADQLANMGVAQVRSGRLAA